MTDNSLKFKSIDFSAQPKRCVIALHGWTGSQESFVPIAQRLKINSTRWYFLQGPYQVSEEKWSWHYRDNDQWILAPAKERLRSFLLDIAFKEFSPLDIYLIGFSQGATVIYNSCLDMEQTIGGLFPIAGYSRKTYGSLHKNQKNTKILIGHGRDDDIVPVSESISINNYLQEHSTNTELYLYNGKHKISFNYLNKFSSAISNGN